MVVETNVAGVVPARMDENPCAVSVPVMETFVPIVCEEPADKMNEAFAVASGIVYTRLAAGVTAEIVIVFELDGTDVPPRTSWLVVANAVNDGAENPPVIACPPLIMSCPCTVRLSFIETGPPKNALAPTNKLPQVNRPGTMLGVVVLLEPFDPLPLRGSNPLDMVEELCYKRRTKTRCVRSRQ